LVFNPQVFKTRSITAVVFVVVMLTGLFWNAWSFLLLSTIIMLGCLYEFFKILKIIFKGNYLYYAPFSLLYIIMPILMIIDLENITVYTAGPKGITYSPLFPCAIIFSIWINDTMAYIVGSLIGRTPFSKISPKKTWEGTIGGIILCIIAITLLGKLAIAVHLSSGHWIAIAIIAAVFGTLGDLFESKLKRMAGIKDSGSFMPGHGGFLDRFDSLLVAIPFVWLYIKIMLP